MLYLSRKVGESVVINDEIEVQIVEVKGKSAKLGITFPAHATVLRREVYERIQAENRAAAESADALSDALGLPTRTLGPSPGDSGGESM